MQWLRLMLNEQDNYRPYLTKKKKKKQKLSTLS